MNLQCKPKCNPVYNFQQNGVSRKMLISKMIKNKKSINYANSQTNSIYITILSVNYDENKKLLLLLKYKLYMKYVNEVISCGKYNSQEIYDMIQSIISNLTSDEYNIVFNIIVNSDITTITKTNKITKTFYISTDMNKECFIIKNYTGEYILYYNTYEFNLEDPTNLNTKFCLSIDQTGVPVDGLIYNGIPGTPGSNLILNAPGNLSYNLFIFNPNSKSFPFYWGYAQPLLPVLRAKQIYSYSSYIPLVVGQVSNLSTYHNNTLKFLIETTDIPYVSSVNYNYLFYYGTYYIQVPKKYTVALLNNNQTDKIQYTGNINKMSTSKVYGTTNDGTYNFYYDTLIVSIYEPFMPISIYSELYGYLGEHNGIIFDPAAANFARPEIRSDHIFIKGIENIAGIEKLYSQTRLNVDYINNTIQLNTDENYKTTSNAIEYGVYNGTYIFFTKEYITFFNKGKEDIFIVSGLNGIIGYSADGITNYTFYSGVIQVKILGDFNKMSIYTYNKGYCSNGLHMLTYNIAFNNYIPHSYSFTTISNRILSETLPTVMNYNLIPLYPTSVNFVTDDNPLGSSSGISRSTYNIISISDNKIIFNDIPYNSNNQYTMKKGTYIFYSLNYVAFMTNNKPLTYVGYSKGFNIISGESPNKLPYTFYKSDTQIVTKNNIAEIVYFKPITVVVTDNFYNLSICNQNGYNGGFNLLSYVNL